MSTPTSAIQIFGDKALPALGTVEYIIDFERFNLEGIFSLQVAITGADAEVDISYELTNMDQNPVWIDQEAAGVIAEAFTEASGPGTDGNALFDINPKLSRKIKFIFTETAEAPAVINAWVAMQ